MDFYVLTLINETKLIADLKYYNNIVKEINCITNNEIKTIFFYIDAKEIKH